MRLKLSICLLTLFNAINAQNNEVVFTVNKKPVYKSEVENAYKKQNINSSTKPESITDFLESYIDYRLGLEEAYMLRLDTTPEYKRQYKSYRIQLVNNFLQDTLFENEYLKQIYNQTLEDVELNHAYIPIKSKKMELFPSDTTDAYIDAIETYKYVLENGFKGDNFTDRTLSERYINPETTSGYLGWVSPFIFSSELEELIYQIPEGEISQPIRINNAYHIIQVIKKRPTKGQRDIQQVMFAYPKSNPTQAEKDSVLEVANTTYKEINTSLGFEPICEAYALAYGYQNGCDFAIVGLHSKLPPIFLQTAFSLEKEGDISQPIISDFGVHILRLKTILPPKNFDHAKIELRKQVLNSDRELSYIPKSIKKMVQIYNVSLNNETLKEIEHIANRISPDSLEFLKEMSKFDNEILFTINDTLQFSGKNFKNHIKSKIELDNNNQDELSTFFYIETPLQTVTTDKLKQEFNLYLYSELRKYEKATLEDYNPEFKTLMQEYSDGILLFDLKNTNIWEKAETDSDGLKRFFETNKRAYKWDQPRFKGVIIMVKDEQIKQQAEMLISESKTNQEVSELLKSTFNSDDSINLKIEEGLWKKGDNDIIDYKIFSGSKPDNIDKEYPFYFVSGSLINSPQNIEDIKVEVIEDYQNELEKQWLKYLRQKYSVYKNKAVIKTL